MMTQEKLFSEFIELVGWEDPSILSKVDIALDNYILARIDGYDCRIYYLTAGSRATIPGNWIKIFSAFSKHSRSMSLDIKEGNGSNIDRVIYYMLQIVGSLENKNDGKTLLRLLGELSVIKTEDFRDWMYCNYKVRLDPIRFENINDIMVNI